MSLIIRCVSCLHHAAQHHASDDTFFRLAFRFCQHPLDFSGMDFSVFLLHTIAKATDELFHFFCFFSVRLLMGAEHKGNFLPEEVFRNGFVADQHKFLNEVCGNIPIIGLDVNGFTLLVQNDFGFRQIKVYRTAFFPFCHQNFSEFIHFFQHGNDFRIFFQKFRCLVLQNLPYGCVGHAVIRINHRVDYTVVHHIPSVVDFHDAAQCKAIFMRIQGTNAVAQLMGQHRNHPIYQIHTGTSFVSLFVQSSMFLHIMGNVRNMHTQFIISVIQFCQGNSVVQVFGIFPIDGDGQYIAQIFSAHHFFFIDFQFHIFDFLIHFIREFHRQFISADYRKNIHTGVVDVPQNLNDLPFWIPSVFTVVCDFYHNFMPSHCTHGIFSGNENIFCDLFVICCDKAEAFHLFKETNQTGHASFQHANNGTLCFSAAAAATGHFIQHSVFLQSTVGF